MGYVSDLKEHSHIKVLNALHAEGYRYRNPSRAPTNIERMLEGLPLPVLKRIHARVCNEKRR